MTVQVNKSGFGMPTAVAEIMRAKASLAVAEIMKKESPLLTSAFVAGSIALGGIACQNPATPEVEKENNWNPASIEYQEEQTPVMQKDEKKNLEGCIAYNRFDEVSDCSDYNVFLGELQLFIMIDSHTRQEELGYCKVYSISGWRTDGWPTDVIIVFPNGQNYLSSLRTNIQQGLSEIHISGPPGYEGMLIYSAAWRKPTTSIREPERKVPNQSGI